MSKLGGKRPSPALVISMLALFVALGGSAYAATKIGTKNIKNNAITASKIKKNAVTTAKIKNGAVTGAKVNAATLGTVPNATHASTADSASKAIDATNATNFSRYFTSGLKKASVGQTVALGNVGPFSFTGVCEDLGGGEYQAWVKVITSASGSFLYSEEADNYEGDFEPGEEGVASEYSASTTPEWFGYYGYYNEFYAASPSGDVLIEGHANNGIHVFGSDCAFALSYVNEA
jgi:hypothetical protein